MSYLDVQVFGNTIGAYAFSLSIVCFAALAALILKHVLKKYLHVWAERTETRVDDLFVRRLLPLLTYLILAGSLVVAKAHLQLPGTLNAWLHRFFLALLLALLFAVIIRLLQGIIDLAARRYVQALKTAAPGDLELRLRNAERIKKQVKEICNMVIGLLAILTILLVFSA